MCVPGLNWSLWDTVKVSVDFWEKIFCFLLYLNLNLLTGSIDNHFDTTWDELSQNGGVYFKVVE